MEKSKQGAKVVGITMGDPAGIGPEVVLKALESREIKETKARFIIIGDRKVLKKNSQLLSINLPAQAEVLDLANINYHFRMAKVDRRLGKAVLEYIKEGVRLAQEKRIDALVTAPISKEAINLAGYRYAGHTQLLAELTQTKDVRMLFSSPVLKVVLLTTHLPLKEVSKLITAQGVYKTIVLAAKFMHRYFAGEERIGVAGFNPHAGEEGLFGEEEREIKKGIFRAQQEGVKVDGPFPADTLFYQAYKGRYKLVVAIYHDQGLIPFKLLSFRKGVNISLGLPIIRTSPCHGTAFDIAGQGVADPDSMIEAIKMALYLSQRC
ncbi:MAG: 4-hydroxythreonine-4-phosphate dehydrogenase PdxA [Candidatus Omnitrophota bacterium]|nr:MAG: 4-hydroxythreonine-4-phosphate dehydrogenase PdxA [Candidatus Omnitrophota bacterium]